MTGSRRIGGRRSQRSSTWVSTLILEAIALLAIIGVAQPLFFQRMLQRLGSQVTPAVTRPAINYPSINFLHPMDAFQPPLLAPAQFPAHTANSYSFLPPPDSKRPANN